MTMATRTSVAISSGGISAQLIRLLPPAGCPGEAVWVPSNEVQRWEQLGFIRGSVPAADLELAWVPAEGSTGDLAGSIAVELLLNPRSTPPNAVTVDWGDGTAETRPWPVGGDGNGQLRHCYTSRRDYTITAELSGSGINASLLVSLAGCPIWSPEPPAPAPGPGPTPGPGTVLPLIPGAGLSGVAYDGSTTQQWSLTRWSGGSSAGGVPASDGSSSLFLCADGSWTMPPGSGTRWFNGAGPPPLTISGAEPGDYYLDNLSGNFYVLEG
jgi:hypothetical protein